MQEQPTVLLVDDMPANLSILFDFLSENNFEILVARDGESAIELMEHVNPLPDLILLDVMMPGLGGFETCLKVKENPKTQDIPIIFMTALTDTVDKVKGLTLGAVDYITKPFQQDEVLARIHTHLIVRRLQQQLRLKNIELELQYQLVVELNEQLKKKNEELESQYSLTLQLNERLEKEIEARCHIENALQEAKEALIVLGNFSKRTN